MNHAPGQQVAIPQPPQPQQPQQPPQAWYQSGKLAALLTMVPLIALAGAGASKLIELGKTQSTVEMQSQKIAELTVEKSNVTAQNEKLLERTRSLELNLESATTRLTNAENKLGTMNSQITSDQAEITRLREQIAQNDPCLSIQKTIAAFEAQLDLHDTYRYLLMGPRRTETQAQLIDHQTSLRSCLSRRS